MEKYPISQEEIFFGIIRADGSRSSLAKRQPSVDELAELRRRFPFGYTHRCECGATSNLYSHILRTQVDDPNRVESSTVHHLCPECGRRVALGANYHLMSYAYSFMKKLIEENAAK